MKIATETYQNNFNLNLIKIFYKKIKLKINIKIKQNLTFIKNRKIVNLLKNSQFDLKKETINYEYSNNFNQENLFLMSQTYLFYKIWQKGTINKYNLKSLLKNWTSNLILRKT